jgi:beta-phosphoglucomutase-like phosphatase (HAD superfamily)/dTDP-glucose pyrophosphorylase
MNKLVIFDLDGVLIDSRELHYEALNKAILDVAGEQYLITREEHLSKYDGLNTTKKLQMLAEEKGLDAKHFDDIWKAKQKATFDLIPNCPKNPSAHYIMSVLNHFGWKVAVASNSIRQTVKIALNSMDVMKFVDYIVSNEDVKYPKPYPEMYWKCMVAMKALPKDTIIVEDSHLGREGAINSGGVLYPVKDAYELNGNTFIDMIESIDVKQTELNIPWRNKKMNVLIPMAGAGSRFAQAGYTFPKPLIEVNGKPMIQVVTENLNVEAHFIYIVQKEHYEKYNLKQLLNLISPGCDIIQVDGLTEGAACTTLLAKELINNDEPLMMANSDQFVEWNSNECLYAFTADSIDGGIITFEATHPKWSFAKLGTDGFVSEVAEKNPISNLATVGIYYWKHGSDYVKYAEQMIEKNIRTNNEFYVCPVFNEAIQDGKKIRAKNIKKMWGIGTPEDLNYFLEHYK